MKTLVFIFSVLAATCGLSPAGPTLVNGSFEFSAPTANPGGSFVTLITGSTEIDGWTVIGSVNYGAIDYIGGYWQPADGARSLDLNGSNDRGGVTQTLATVAGQAYEVRFFMSGNPDGDPATKTLMVSAGADSAEFSFTVSGSRNQMGWVETLWHFTAMDSSTDLTFQSMITGSYGPALDNVSVCAVVPAPGAILLAGIGTSLVGWLRRRRSL